MKSTLRNMVVVLFTITAVSAFLVGVVNNVTKARSNANIWDITTTSYQISRPRGAFYS